MRALLFAILLFPCVSFAAAPIGAEDPAYDELFPHYAEVCGYTQLVRANGKEGGRGGHASLYLRGACRDRKSALPRLTACEGDGAHISVNKFFKNARWVGIEGRELGLRGTLPKGAPLTEAEMEKLANELDASGMFDSIQVHDRYLKTKLPEESEEQYIIRNAIGTDVGANYARHAYCSRVVLNRAMIDDMISYLNRENEEYAAMNPPFEWHWLKNNCVHLIQNALASIWVRGPESLLNLAVPGNEVIETAENANDESFTNVRNAFKDKLQRNAILRYGALAVQPGALSLSVPARSEVNDIFSPKDSLFILDSPLAHHRRRKFEKIMEDDRYVDLRANFEHFEERFRKAKKKQKPLSKLLKKVKDPAFPRFYERYYAWVDSQLAAVHKMMDILR